MYLARAFGPHASGRPSSDREDSVPDPTIFHPVGCRASLHDAFGEDGLYVLVFRALRPCGHFWVMPPIIPFTSMSPVLID
jgi:hypothetical protein